MKAENSGRRVGRLAEITAVAISTFPSTAGARRVNAKFAASIAARVVTRYMLTIQTMPPSKNKPIRAMRSERGNRSFDTGWMGIATMTRSITM